MIKWSIWEIVQVNQAYKTPPTKTHTNSHPNLKQNLVQGKEKLKT